MTIKIKILASLTLNKIDFYLLTYCHLPVLFIFSIKSNVNFKIEKTCKAQK